MDDILRRTVKKLDKRRRRTKGWRSIVRVIAAAVVFCTTYALILPAITAKSEPICGLEEHVHSEECYSVPEVHIHSEGCLDGEGHVLCAYPDCGIHLHDSYCSDAEGVLLCSKTTVEEHVHSAACLTVWDIPEPVLSCGLTEHTHDLPCYPLEEAENPGLSYICGFSEHSHCESCMAEDGSVSCTVPEHSHDVSCAVEGYDPNADVETSEQWESMAASLGLSGIWADDIVKLAAAQVGYAESGTNCVLEGDELRGYTRYGAWFGDAYADWDDMFVCFCLNYTGISSETVPYVQDSALWLQHLSDMGMFVPAGEYVPCGGDIIFLDTNGDGFAERSGIVETAAADGSMAVIAGDSASGTVAREIVSPSGEVLGFCPLPENPMAPSEIKDAVAVSELIAQLPRPEKAVEALRELNEAGDRAGYEALRQEIAGRIEEIEEAWSALDDEQKALVEGYENTKPLKEACGGESWNAFPALEDDSAVISALTAEKAQLVSRAAQPVEETVVPEGAVLAGDTLAFPFTVEISSYYEDVRYGEAKVKIELVLPLAWEKAQFDTEAMNWLENFELNSEIRSINGEDVLCQVLTGYKKLLADETVGVVAPGSFGESVLVNVSSLDHGQRLWIEISAAMEHGAWEGECPEHLTEEKLSVVSEALVSFAPADEETMKQNYEDFLTELRALSESVAYGLDLYFDAGKLLEKIAEAYAGGAISEAQYDELAPMAGAMRAVDLSSIAEPCVGTNWMKDAADYALDAAESELALTGHAENDVIYISSAMKAEVYNAVFPSTVQIDKIGGDNTSADGAVYVSKTIEGTDTENVFDITLKVITKDEVNEVYKDPDMAVVVVMDISNTMRSNFGNTTRYKAAMDAGEDFLEKFAAQNSTLSRVGYVAFNTSGHEIFPLSQCDSAADAASLASVMRRKTGTIINAGGYASASTRFTNMEAGLKRAYDMLAAADNQHKYIIFISDGFPTTYIKSGYTGWDPNCSSGTKDTDGVFYDDVTNRYCQYGTSYSDTAAIKARQLAVNLKNQGVNIFSIGVDVGGQTLWNYHNQSVNADNNTDNFSVVERRNEASWYRANGYEIGTMHDKIDKTSITAAQANAMAQDFKDWLKGTAASGIGSGYYYDSTNLSGLNAAYDSIFQKILELNASSSHLDWVATDPMPDMGVHEVEAMEFIGFWDRDGNLVEKLVGESNDGAQYENTADFHTDTNTIHWDLKNSGYISQGTGNATTYTCEMSYRIRLKNEESVFVENQVYDTNDVTSLTYRIIEVKGSQTSVSERRTVSFPIPAVHGYLAELKFLKTGPIGEALSGAEFTLSHDTSSCGYCRGDFEGYVPLDDMVAESDGNGYVSFSRIPSGHSYTLTETKVPEGYLDMGNSYKVVVAYDALTVTVTDADGNPLEWNDTIANGKYYTLPNTGGSGTQLLTFGGLLLVAAAMMYSLILFRQKRKGGARR